MRHRTSLVLGLVVGTLLLTACSDTGGGTADEPAAPEEPTAAATQDASADDAITLTADTVSGPLNIPDDQRAGAVCVLQSRFPRNSEIVWRARVFDVAGQELDDTQLDSVEVQLADGQTFDMRYGPHPSDDPTDFFWTAAFDVPADYPTGTLDYEIVATTPDGTTGTYRPFNVAPSLLTVTEETLEQIEEEEA